MQIPAPVQDVVDEYAHQITNRLPNLLDSLFVTGSIALDAYRHGASDIDFTAVLARPAGRADTAVLADIHAALPEAPAMDGFYLTTAQMSRRPEAEPTMLRVADGRTESIGIDQLPLILFLDLDRHAITLRGRSPQDHGMSIEPGELRQWLRHNLATYWTGLADELRSGLAGRTPDSPVNPATVYWAMSGPPRLHYTLTTGDIVSKQDALGYAREQLTDIVNVELIDRCLAWRDGESTSDFTVDDGRRAADHINAVVTDGLRQRTDDTDHAHRQ